MAMTDITKVSQKKTPVRVEPHWLGGKLENLEVYEIPIAQLYFNIENGRYADRMIKLRHENPGKQIDPRETLWKEQIERMLAGEHKDTSKDKAAFEKLLDDIRAKTQLHPGVVTRDGGVIDGNRRLAALQRLNKDNRDQFRCFDGVVLPANTTSEDRWRIEAGLQLGVNERWNYSPINELLKVREGVKLYEEMIRRGALPKSPNPVQRVAAAIYGKSEADIRENVSRLDLFDEYLQFIKKAGAYDELGRISEDMKEAARVVQAAENAQRAPEFLAKLKAVLFYLIHRDEMTNWNIRRFYDALGGDPKKPGRRPSANERALAEYLGQFPDAKSIRASLVREEGQKATTKAAPTTGKTSKGGVLAAIEVDRAKVAAATQRFLSTMETQAEPPRRIAASASAKVEALHAGLAKKAARDALSPDDLAAVREAVKEMQKLLLDCLSHLKKI
jgi:hypothetical protein